MGVNSGSKLHDVISECPLNENFSQFLYGKQMFKRKMFLCLTTLRSTTLRSTTFRSYHFLPNPFQVLPLLGLPRTRPVDAPFIIVDLTFWRFTYWRLFNIVFKIKLFLRKKTIANNYTDFHNLLFLVIYDNATNCQPCQYYI